MLLIKLIGALIGYWIGGWVGAILGWFLSSFVLAAIFLLLRKPLAKRLKARQATFMKGLFQLMGYMAKADGRVSEQEVAVAERFMAQLGIAGEARSQAILQFKIGANLNYDPQPVLQQFKRSYGRSKQFVQVMLVYLIGIALADGELSDSEHRRLVEIAGALSVTPEALERIIEMVKAQSRFGGAQNSGLSINDAYKALGVKAEDNDATIKRAYRKLMSQYHPDKLIGQGVPEDMVKVATEKSQEVQKAYDTIKRMRAAAAS